MEVIRGSKVVNSMELPVRRAFQWPGGANQHEEKRRLLNRDNETSLPGYRWKNQGNPPPAHWPSAFRALSSCGSAATENLRVQLQEKPDRGIGKPITHWTINSAYEWRELRNNILDR
ncbi:hypothetical protein KM043_012015 [Ampulex compressa]|nr:hypothetical protein KM043_012015 [Ampulex compressa]